MRPDMNPDIKPDDIAHYLQDHPEFFEQYADLLSLVTLADPHSGRAISITEKQLVSLRDKVHGLAVALIAAGDRAAVLRALFSHLGGAFAVPHVTLRQWGHGEDAGAVPDSIKAFASGMQQPYCGAAADQEALAWFGESASHLRSMTQIALRQPDGVCFGLLLMASEDPHRFYPELGTLYLERIGEMAAAALLRVAH